MGPLFIFCGHFLVKIIGQGLILGNSNYVTQIGNILLDHKSFINWF